MINASALAMYSMRFYTLLYILCNEPSNKQAYQPLEMSASELYYFRARSSLYSNFVNTVRCCWDSGRIRGERSFEAMWPRRLLGI